MADLEQRVAAGAALLDRERPGWWEEVDTKRLAMASDCDCVLGQLDGDYGAGRDALGLEDEEAYACGFSDRWYDALDRLWLAAVAERRARAESVGPTAEEWATQR